MKKKLKLIGVWMMMKIISRFKKYFKKDVDCPVIEIYKSYITQGKDIL